MQNIAYLFVMLFLLASNICGQLQLQEIPNLVSEAKIYKDESGNLFSTLFKFKHKYQISIETKGKRILSENDFSSEIVKTALKKLKNKYGQYTIAKTIPKAIWGDTLKVNKKTKQIIHINDYSQVYTLVFEKPVLIDSVKAFLNKIPGVAYSSGPNTYTTTISPNDPGYGQGDYKWSFDVIQAEKAWSITTGSPTIRIGIFDFFGGDSLLHSDLVGKVDIEHLIDTNIIMDTKMRYGNHGISVAGAAAAATNNGAGISSLGWNCHLVLAKACDDHLWNLVYNDNVDIINFSMTNHDSWWPNEVNLLHEALKLGIVLVGSAGNDGEGVRYPAAYNFGNDGQVIAVSATQKINQTEQFILGFTSSPGTDPINDPTNAFIDLAAPGSNYLACSMSNSDSYQTISAATSISAPFVSGLIGLMLSVNNSLSPNQIYEILKNTSDKIGTIPYNSIGWNKYYGYGRINAWDAVNVANGAPTRVKNFNNTSITQDHPVFSWESNISPNINSYKIYKNLDNAGWQLAGTISYPNTTYTDNSTSMSQLSLNSNIKYYITAFNNINKESIPGNEIAFTQPGAPTNLTRTYQNLEHPSLTWTLSTNQNIVRYEIFRNYDAQGWSYLAQTDASTNTFVDNSIGYTKQPWQKPIQYYVKAVSNVNLYSQPTNTLTIDGILIPEPDKKEINQQQEIIPTEYSLGSYPNPFNPATVIRFALPVAGQVSIKVYNLLSQEVASLVDDNKSAGVHTVNFNAISLSTGIYIVRLQAGSKVISIKLQLIK